MIDNINSVEYKEMFNVIESMNVNRLILLCKKLKEKKINIKTYHPVLDFRLYKKINKKASWVGIMDFSPVQHAINIGWLDGVKILKEYNIGLVQGCGMKIVYKKK